MKRTNTKLNEKIVEILDWEPKEAKWHIQFFNYKGIEMLVADENLIRFEKTNEKELEKKMKVRIKSGIFNGQYNNKIGRLSRWSERNKRWEVSIDREKKPIKFFPWEIDVNDWNIKPQPKINPEPGIIVPILESGKDYRSRVKLLQYNVGNGKWKIVRVDGNNNILQTEGHMDPKEFLLSNIGQPMPKDSMYSLI